MSLFLQKETGVFKNSLLPAEAQVGLVNEIRDKLKRAVNGNLLGSTPLYLAVSNFSYRGHDVLNTPFDFSTEKPAEVDAGIDLLGPLAEQLAGAIAFGFQEAFILSRQRFREGDRDQLLHLAHIGDGAYHLCTRIGEFSHLTGRAQSIVDLKSVIKIASNTAEITYSKQIRDAEKHLQVWSNSDEDKAMILREEKAIKTATEHLAGVDRGQALLLEALGYPWSTDDKT